MNKPALRCVGVVNQASSKQVLQIPRAIEYRVGSSCETVILTQESRVEARGAAFAHLIQTPESED